MQWLFTIMIELFVNWIHTNGIYTDRGTYGGADFQGAQLPCDDNWYELDLSSIIPEHTKAVIIRCKMRANAVNKVFRMRKHGTTMTFFSCVQTTQIANQYIGSNPVIGVDADRKIDFRGQAGCAQEANIVIRGWWL